MIEAEHSRVSFGDKILMEKKRSDFGDLDPIFKLTGGQRKLENALCAPYLLKGWMDFKQICTYVSLGDAKEVIRI